MSSLQIAFTILSVLIGFAGLVVNFARIAPVDAKTNLGKWLNASVALLKSHRYIAFIVFIPMLLLPTVAIIFLLAQNSQIDSLKKPSVETKALQIPVSDEEVHGWLKPADDPTPPNGCDERPLSKPGTNSIKILIGDNAVGMDGFGKFTALKIGNCEAISMERTEDGVAFNAQLSDLDGSQVVKILKNEIVALNGENYSARQSQNRDTIVVKDKKGGEIFYARYVNPTTVVVRGWFGCKGQKPLKVSEHQPIPGFFMSHSCFMNGSVGIGIGP